MNKWTEEEFLNHKQWFHTTSLRACENILSNGILADFNKGIELDFGYGFYLTPSFDWSIKYSKGFIEPRILEYHFTPRQLLSHNTNYRFFDELNTLFAEFVFRNRMYFEQCETKCVHSYDLVGGVMSDGNQPVDFEEFRDNLISKQELYRRLCLPKEDWQLVLHSQKLCDAIGKPYFIHDTKGGVIDVSN